jgi:hypothetical protein
MKNYNKMYMVQAKQLTEDGVGFKVVHQRLNLNNEIVVVDHSTIMVHNLSQRRVFDEFQERAKDMENYVDILSRKYAVRQNDVMAGTMTPFGFRDCDKYGNHRAYSATKTDELKGLQLQRLMTSYQKVLKEVSPSFLSSVKLQSEYFGVKPSQEMGGVKGVTPSMVVSVNLGNPPHKDALDLGTSATIWTEKGKGEANNWYFVMPNIHIKRNGQTYEGLAVKLCHGAYVEWDGMVRHSTSLTNVSYGNAVYGWFVGNNHRNLSTRNRMNRW